MLLLSSGFCGYAACGCVTMRCTAATISWGWGITIFSNWGLNGIGRCALLTRWIGALR
jgi:hypothetical protein